jgi:hypothetical protein
LAFLVIAGFIGKRMRSLPDETRRKVYLGAVIGLFALALAFWILSFATRH